MKEAAPSRELLFLYSLYNLPSFTDGYVQGTLFFA